MAIVEGSTEGTLHKSTNQVLLKVVQTMTVGYIFGWRRRVNTFTELHHEITENALPSILVNLVFDCYWDENSKPSNSET